MDAKRLQKIIECLLFVSSNPLSLDKLSQILEEVSRDEIVKAIENLKTDYNTSGRPVFIQNVAGGWRMASRPEYGEWVRRLFVREITIKLSKAAMESLAIVAYKQPVTTQDVENIRGVSAGAVLRGLLEKKLIKIAGRKESLGRPILYKTSDKFLEYFGLDSISDLPPLEEFGIKDELQELIDERSKKKNRQSRQEDQQAS